VIKYTDANFFIEVDHVQCCNIPGIHAEVQVDNQDGDGVYVIAESTIFATEKVDLIEAEEIAVNRALQRAELCGIETGVEFDG
jgi:hypothetical protein